MNEIRKTCLEKLGELINDQYILARIEEGESILSSGAIDSLSLVNLIVELETALGFSFESDDLEDIFGSLDNLVRYIESRIR